VALVLSRQNLPVLEATARNKADVARGGYVLADADGQPDVILIATGSEVSLALGAKAELGKDGVKVRVVAMPSRELFERQPEDYRASVLPDGVAKRLVIEAGISLGWDRYAGPGGKVLSIDTFGASGPGGAVLKHFGFSVDNVVNLVRELVK